MLGYLFRRILAAVPVMGVVALFVFLLLRLTPGDPAAILAGDNATPEQLERIRTSLASIHPSTKSRARTGPRKGVTMAPITARTPNIRRKVGHLAPRDPRIKAIPASSRMTEATQIPRGVVN